MVSMIWPKNVNQPGNRPERAVCPEVALFFGGFQRLNEGVFIQTASVNPARFGFFSMRASQTSWDSFRMYNKTRSGSSLCRFILKYSLLMSSNVFFLQVSARAAQTSVQIYLSTKSLQEIHETSLYNYLSLHNFAEKWLNRAVPDRLSKNSAKKF